MLHASGDLASYFAALSLPKDIIKPYSRMIDKMLQCNGEQWTVDRCKSIYNDFVRYNAGLEPVGVWYKKNSEGLPSGILSRIFKLGKSKKFRFSCHTLLRSYTRYTSKDVTEEQLSKFLKGVTSVDNPQSYRELSSLMRSTMVTGYGRRLSVIKQPSFISYNPSPGKRVPDAYGKTHPEETHWPYQWETIDTTKLGRGFRLKYANIFSDVFQGVDCMRTIAHGKHMSDYNPDSVGKIGLIQEPGFKLRAVANPNRVYQVALKPLGDVIYDYIKELPWDCTFNQSKAIPVIQNYIKNNGKAHCIDLTGATDYFPLQLQLDLLLDLFPSHSQYIELFKDISRSPWFFQDTMIVWQKGQPLGLYPSFGSFALTHGSLLFSLNGGKHENMFFVLGDDVVILDDGLALKYLNALKLLECPISLHKSISSTRVAEFGGKLIYHDQVIPQLKWRQLSDDNFVDVMKLLGSKALRLLRPQQRQVVKAIWTIPDLFGGLGFNPDGIPFKDRYELYLTLFGEETKSTFLMSYDRKFNSFFNESLEQPNKGKLSHFWNNSTLPDLDQRSAALCSKYLPMMLKWYGIMGTNLYTVSLDKGVLPTDGITSKRSTLLTQLQRKLSI